MASKKSTHKICCIKNVVCSAKNKMKKMFVQRVLFYALTVFIVFTTAAKSYAQNNSWLKRDWEGRAYTLGNDPQNFSLTLTISSVKGKEFEGVIKAFETANPSNHFDSKISGVVNDRYL